MALASISCAALCLAIAALNGMAQLPAAASSEYPGVIELVGFSNRRARTHYMPAPYARQLDDPTLAPPPAKTQADIETVKQNIEKYNKLLTLDTKNLPESQKDMLERIVERVARLKESLDIEERADARLKAQNEQAASALSTAPTAAPFTIAEAETDPTLVLDETTLLQLQTSMDELAAAQAAVTAQTTRVRELPTTTEFSLDAEPAINADGAAATDNTDSETGADSAATDYVSTTIDPLTDATDPDDQFVAARSNNNIAAITAADADTSSTLSTTAGNQRTLTTSGKMKTRATKRPSTSASKNTATAAAAAAAALTTSKRGQRPATAAAAAAAALNKQTTTKQKLTATTISTAQPLQYQKQQHQKPQQQQQYAQKVSPATGNLSEKTAVTAATLADPMHQRTPQAGSPSGSTAAAAAAAAASTVYDSNANADLVYDAHVNTSAIIDSLNHGREEFYQQKQTVNNKDKKPSATAKPTKYHYYPHNQHIYLLPECAIQQVCNAVYVRLNYTQPLCACPSRYRDPCSASLNEDDQHTTKLVGDGKKKAITLAKTCEATTEMRECRSPKDWSLLALQNTRTGKSHYLVICRCPDHFKMEGPMAHDQPTYASVPGIRVFGMMCVKPGYSVHKPSAQPPKRYQLQKPFYRPSSQSSYLSSSSGNNGGAQYANKDSYGRPAYGGAGAAGSGSNYHAQDVYQSQHQANYQYLNRPESSHISAGSSANYRPESLSINSFPGGIYGRNNERKGDPPIEAATEEDNKLLVSTSTQPTEEARTSNASDENANDNGSAGASAQTDQLANRKKRSLAEQLQSEFEVDDTPAFPWDRVLELQQSIIWE